MFYLFLFDKVLFISYLAIMENENDSLARTAHVFGITDVEFEAREGFPPAPDLPLPPAGFVVRPSGSLREASPEELSDWVAEDILDGEFDD